MHVLFSQVAGAEDELIMAPASTTDKANDALLGTTAKVCDSSTDSM